MSQTDTAEEYEKQRTHSLHQTNLSDPQTQGDDSDAAEILRYLSENEDLPIKPEDDPILGPIVSTLTSTANLTAEQVRSNEWWIEIIILLYIAERPVEGGLPPSLVGYAHGDPSHEGIEPLTTRERIKLESHGMMGSLAMTRSRDAKVMEEGARTITESVVEQRDGESKQGGLRGRLGL